MKLEYNLINGKTEKNFQKLLSPVKFGSTIKTLQAITPEVQEAIYNIKPNNFQTVITGFSNAKIMNGIDIKGFPYLLFNDPETHELTFYIGREALNYDFHFFLDDSDPLTPIYSDILKLQIIEKDGSITTESVIADKNTTHIREDSSIQNTVEHGLEYYIGTPQ